MTEEGGPSRTEEGKRNSSEGPTETVRPGDTRGRTGVLWIRKGGRIESNRINLCDTKRRRNVVYEELGPPTRTGRWVINRVPDRVPSVISW